MAKKYCYLFTEGNATMREILGGKGANLAEMTNIGLPVPQGFTISTEAVLRRRQTDQSVHSGGKYGLYRQDGKNHRKEIRR